MAITTTPRTPRVNSGGRLHSFSTDLGEGNSEFKTIEFRLKTDLLSHPVRAKGLYIYILKSVFVGSKIFFKQVLLKTMEHCLLYLILFSQVSLLVFLYQEIEKIKSKMINKQCSIVFNKTCLNIYIIGSVGRVFANGPGDLGSIPGRVIPNTFKMVFDTSLLNTQQYKVCIEGKKKRSSALPYTSV